MFRLSHLPPHTHNHTTQRQGPHNPIKTRIVWQWGDSNEDRSRRRAMPPTAGLPVDPATTASERDNRPTAVAEAEAGPQQQPLQRQFVDILQRGLPLDAVFQVEVFLPVPTLLG